MVDAGNVRSALGKQLYDAENKITQGIEMDCTNPSKPNFAGLKFSGDTSGGEQVAKWAQDGFEIHQRKLTKNEDKI